MSAPDDPAPVDGADAYRARIKGTNIDERTLLATDYLNHFNEIVMLLELVPDLPDCLEDAKEWRPKSYAEHFRDSGFVDGGREAPRAPRGAVLDRLHGEQDDQLQ